MPAVNGHGRKALVSFLKAMFWPVFAGFAMIVVFLLRDRACVDRMSLPPALASTPAAAWIVATWYVMAHCWVAVAYAVIIADSARLLPDRRLLEAVWRRAWPQLVFLIVVFGLEYTPRSLVRTLGRISGACPLP